MVSSDEGTKALDPDSAPPSTRGQDWLLFAAAAAIVIFVIIIIIVSIATVLTMVRRELAYRAKSRQHALLEWNADEPEASGPRYSDGGPMDHGER